MEQELETENFSDEGVYRLGHREGTDGQRRKTEAFLGEGVGEKTKKSIASVLDLYFYFANDQSLDVNITYLAIKNKVKKLWCFVCFCRCRLYNKSQFVWGLLQRSPVQGLRNGS